MQCIVCTFPEQINRGQVTMIVFTVFRILQALTRTMSVYLSILFALERFIAISNPFQFKIAYKRKRIILLFGVIGFCLIMNLPYMTKYKVVENKYFTLDDSSYEIMQFPYLTERGGFAIKLPWIVKHFLLAFDRFIPFPLIIWFHLLFYMKVFQYLIG